MNKTIVLLRLYAWFVCLVCCFHTLLSAQTQRFDSLSTILRTTTNNSIRLQTLLALAHHAEFSDPRQVDKYSAEALTLAQQVQDTIALVECYCLFAMSNENKGLQIRSFDYCYRALALARLSQHPIALATALNQLSQEYRVSIRYDSAIIAAERSMAFALRASDSVRYARAWGNLGQVYARQRRYEEAMTIFQRIHPLFEKAGQDGDYVITLSRMGNVLGFQGEREKELFLYQNIAKTIKKNEYTLCKAENVLSIGEALFHLKRYDEALSHLKYAQATADSLEVQSLREESNLYLSQVYEALGKPTEALFHYKQIGRFTQHADGDDTDQQTLEIRRYEQLLKDQQILLMQREAANERLKQIAFIIAAIGVVLLLLAGIAVWRSRENKYARERDEELKLFASYTSDVITRHDLNGTYQYVSPGSHGLLGYAPSDLLGKNPYPFIHPDDIRGVKKSYKQAIISKEYGSHVFRFRMNNGEYRWIEVMFKPILDAKGTITEFIHTSRDVSKRIEAEQKLRKSEEALRATLENTPNVAIQWYNQNAEVVLWNNASEKIFGWTEEEAIGKTLDKLIHTPEETDAFKTMLKTIEQTGEVMGPFEYHYTRKDGISGYGQSSTFVISVASADTPLFVCMDVDITERKKAEIALRENGERLRSIVEAISEGLILQNSAGEIIFCNPAVARILGVSEAELLGATSLDFQNRTFHEDGSPFLPADYPARLTLTTGEPQSEVVMGLAKPDGTLSWIAVNSRPLYHHKNDQLPSAVVMTYVNITERRAAERRLRERELQLTALIESTSDTIYSVDTDYRLLIFNTAYKKAVKTAFGADIKPGFDVLSLLPPTATTEIATWKDSLDRVLAGEQYTTIYAPIFGEEQTFTEIMFNPILSDDGIVNGVVAFNRDITPIKRAEERLRKSEEILRQTSNIAKVGGWELNLRTTPPQMMWTETTYDICALPYGTHVDMHSILAQFSTPEEHTIVDDYLQTTVLSGAGFDYETARTAANSKQLWVRILGNVEVHDGVAVRLYGTIQDITERKEAELLIHLQLNALETKTAEMERFIYTVSHDLKSPLITIKGFLGMIQEDLQAQDYRRITSDLLRIDNAANKMQHLLEDLLELSRVGRVINPSERFSMTVLANETVELLHGILTQRHVRVSVQQDMPRILADKARLREVYQNLIENATKFMGEQTDRHIEIGVERDDIHPIFYVRDNGIGIAKEYQETIFGLFDKLDQHSDGTGIGLALIKRIVELHGGRVWVESEPGLGATFYFTCKVESLEENKGENRIAS